MRVVSLLLGLLTCSLASISALAETRLERKLTQFGGPETRTRCVQEGWTWGAPYNCRITGVTWRTPFGETRCDRDKVKYCTGTATDFLQHEYFLVVTGPDAPDALRNLLKRALDKAIVAALAAAAATPGEVFVKAGAAFAAFKVTLAGALAIEPVLAAMNDEFQISLDERSHW